MVAGRSGVARITLFDPEPFAIRIAGEVKGFSPCPLINPKEARRIDRNVHFAVSAAAEALADSQFEITPENSDDVACVVGTAVGGIKTLLDGQRDEAETSEEQYESWHWQDHSNNGSDRRGHGVSHGAYYTKTGYPEDVQ